MSMMSPEAQLSAPFFLGGVADPRVVSDRHDGVRRADAEHARQQHPASRTPTAFHEMIPGHNLVGYMGSRFADYRARIGGGTPFFGEGWPLYWELTLYDMGFHKTPEERVGALFWRMHRCARIIFSLNFHMGKWSPQEAIDFLVDKVGHERDNATAEVRAFVPGWLRSALPGGLPARRPAAARAAQGARRHASR